MNKAKCLNLFWQVWNQWLKYRYVDPIVGFAKLLATLGVGLMAPGGLWWLAVTLEIVPIEFPVALTVQFGPQTVTGIGFALVLIGVVLGVWGVWRIRKSRSSCLIYLRGMSGMADQAPKNDLPPKYRYGEVTNLSINTHDQSIEDSINDIKYFEKLLDKKSMSMNLDAPVTVFAGLAPVPLLYATGVRLSNRQNLFVMDYDRFEQKWHMLDHMDDSERVVIILPETKIEKDIAIVIPFTIAISKSQIPESLREKAIWIELAGRQPKADAISSEEKLKAILRSIHDLIRNLRSRDGYENLETVHLFIAAQASTLFRLGTEYQKNAYPEIRLYHFDAKAGKYTWGISISDGEIRYLAKSND